MLNFPAAVPELQGALVYLRELREEDIPAWFARATDAESAELAGDPIPESIEVGAEWLSGHRDRFSRRVAIRWAIVPMGETESVGTIGLVITSNEAGTADLGYVVGRAHWGRGFGTDAARVATGYGFETLGLREIYAEVLQRNLASQRVLEKTGFRIHQEVPAEECSIYRLTAAGS